MRNLTQKTLIAVGAAALLAPPLLAQQGMPTEKPGAPDPAHITGGTYKVDHEHTLVRWQVDHLGITPYFGTFGQVTGSLVLDPKNPAAAKVDIVIPVAKVTTSSPALTAHLLRPNSQPGGKPDFFGAAPADAHFVSTAVSPVGNNRATITGNLTLNGATRPVKLDTTFYGAAKLPQQMGGGEGIGFEARATIKRSDFGIATGIPLVSDEVKLDIVAAFSK